MAQYNVTERIWKSTVAYNQAPVEPETLFDRILWLNSRNIYCNIYCLQHHCQKDLSLPELIIQMKTYKFHKTKAASC